QDAADFDGNWCRGDGSRSASSARCRDASHEVVPYCPRLLPGQRPFAILTKYIDLPCEVAPINIARHELPRLIQRAQLVEVDIDAPPVFAGTRRPSAFVEREQ